MFDMYSLPAAINGKYLWHGRKQPRTIKVAQYSSKYAPDNMLALFSVYFNLLLSYATGIVPLAYNFRTGRFERRKWVAALASVLVLLWLSLNFKHKKFSTRMTAPQVGMQAVIHMVEYIVLSTNWVLIGVQQLLHLENYQQRLSELLTSARSWNHRRLFGVPEHLVLLLKLVLLPVGMFSLHVATFELLVNFQVNIVHAFLTMVTLIPNMAHVNNFYAMLFAQRLTLREINDKLVCLWEERARGGRDGGIPGELQVAARLQALLREHEQCAGNVERILQLYSLPVVLYLLLLIQEIISKFFYQFTFFYSLSTGSPPSVVLEVFGGGMIIIYVTETALLVSTCNDISEQSRKIKSAVHRLSLIPRQHERVQQTVKLFLLSLNQSTLEVKIAGMFTIDYDMLVGMVAAISNFVVFLVQFHIDYTNTVMSYEAKNKKKSI